jgi:hypothetical protein
MFRCSDDVRNFAKATKRNHIRFRISTSYACPRGTFPLSRSFLPPSAAPHAALTFQRKGCIGCINALSPPLPGFILAVIGHFAHLDILSRQPESSHTVRPFFVSLSSDDMAAALAADGATVSSEHSGGGTSAEFSVADPSAQENVVVKIGMVGDAGVGQ